MLWPLPQADRRDDPLLDYTRQHLVKESGEPEEKDLGDFGRVYTVVLRVEVTPKAYQELLKREANHRLELRKELAGERQQLALKVLGAAVLLLGAVAAYFRLDDATKGYYSVWLRLGAVGLIAVAAAGLLTLL
jgi:hypothetical protein